MSARITVCRSLGGGAYLLETDGPAGAVVEDLPVKYACTVAEEVKRLRDTALALEVAEAKLVIEMDREERRARR